MATPRRPAIPQTRSPQAANERPLIFLENDLIRAEFDAQTGALASLENRQTGWKIQQDASLARSFELVAPLPERLLHRIDGNRQKLTRVERDPGGARVDFYWEGVDSPHAGRLDIRILASAELDDEGLRFTMEIENRSALTVESCAYPVIGDLQRPASSQRLSQASCSYDRLVVKSIYPEFPNERGYWGTEFPIQLVPTPETLFVLIQGDDEGVYVGCHDTEARERVEFTFQLIPGYGRPNFVPTTAEYAGVRVRTEFYSQHLPFIQPGETVKLSPIVLKPFRGDWQAGLDVYKAWRKTWMQRIAPIPGWLNEPHAWQSLQMNSWGDSLSIRYDELPAYVAECAQNGVSAIQLIGWTLYGQDGRLPIHDTDPRLGARESLKAAIQTAQAQGVKIVLYEKYTCVDKGVDRYQDDLRRLASKDSFGNVHGHEGWRYDTPAHLAGVNIRPYAWMCMNSSEWQDACLAEIRKSLELQPDGILLDESMWHGANAFYCFDRSHGHRVPAYNFAGDAAFERRLCKLLNEIDPNLALAGEGPYDLQNRHYALSYHRAGEGHIPAMRYIDPFLPMMNWVYGYDDREAINTCLLYRYIISYEPRHFRGRLSEFPDTLAYGKQVDALRLKYRAYLWDAAFQGTREALVTAEGQLHQPYAVFKNETIGKRAVVIVNPAQDESIRVRVDVQGCPADRLWAVTPETPEPQASGETVHIGPRSAVVLLEK